MVAQLKVSSDWIDVDDGDDDDDDDDDVIYALLSITFSF